MMVNLGLDSATTSNLEGTPVYSASTHDKAGNTVTQSELGPQ